MNEPRKNNPYAALVLALPMAMQATGYSIFCVWRIHRGEVGWAVADGIMAYLLLAATIFHVRIVWVELRKSDPHFQKL